jgi:predicted DNA-binding transcriptional regulator YafY
LEREILAYGEEVEVLEPEALRKNIATRVERMAKRYT